MTAPRVGRVLVATVLAMSVVLGGAACGKWGRPQRTQQRMAEFGDSSGSGARNLPSQRGSTMP